MAAYYCALDPATPRARAVESSRRSPTSSFDGATDPDLAVVIPGLGFTDDAAVLTALFGLSSYITPVHRAQRRTRRRRPNKDRRIHSLRLRLGATLLRALPVDFAAPLEPTDFAAPLGANLRLAPSASTAAAFPF